MKSREIISAFLVAGTLLHPTKPDFGRQDPDKIEISLWSTWYQSLSCYRKQKIPDQKAEDFFFYNGGQDFSEQKFEFQVIFGDEWKSSINKIFV